LRTQDFGPAAAAGRNHFRADTITLARRRRVTGKCQRPRNVNINLSVGHSIARIKNAAYDPWVMALANETCRRDAVTLAANVCAKQLVPIQIVEAVL
jgi:hypothetical protein